MHILNQANVREYYQRYEAQLNQSLIDQKVKEHLGAAAFRPVGPPYPMRPGLPVLPTPQMPIPGTAQMPPGAPLMPGFRPPILPRPMPGAPGIVLSDVNSVLLYNFHFNIVHVYSSLLYPHRHFVCIFLLSICHVFDS